jgi:hypothetical protein
MAAIISAKGAARDLLNHGLRGAYELIISADVIAECERNLRTKRAEIEAASGMVTTTPDEILRQG